MQRSASVPAPRRTPADVYAFDGQPTFGEEEAFELRQYWDTIRRHYRLIIAIFVIAELVTCAVLLLWTPLYTAVSTIMVERQAPPLLASTATSDQPEISGVDTFYRTQYEILQSRSIAARVILDLGLEKNRYFNKPASKPSVLRTFFSWIASLTSPPPIRHLSEPLGVPGKIIDAYLLDLTIRPQFSTRLVRIAFSSPDPSLSARVAKDRKSVV